MSIPKIRLGKDVPVEWTILTNGVEDSLEERDIKVILRDRIGRVSCPVISKKGNIVCFSFFGNEQKVSGEYWLTLYENYGQHNQNVVDIRHAFELMRDSADLSDSDEETLLSPLQFSSNLSTPITNESQLTDKNGKYVYDASGKVVTD